MRVIGAPKTTFRVVEGSILSTEFIRVLNESNIKQMTTINNAPYVEVFRRTLK
jgi:hypothetical protein